MDLHDAAALLTARAQHAFTLQQQANAALTQEGQRTAPRHRRLVRLAHQAERGGELAALWDGVLWEAHGTNTRDLFPLADPARLVAGVRTLRKLTHAQITGAYDLTCAESTQHAPENPAQHWAERIFLLHTALVDHLPGAATAAAVLAELHDRLTLSPAGDPTALDLVTALRERIEAGPAAARDIPCRAGDILMRALELAAFHDAGLAKAGGNRTAIAVPLAEGWTIRIKDEGSADHSAEYHGTGRSSTGWSALLHSPDGGATDVIRAPDPDTAHECLADSAACVRKLSQWRVESEAKGGPVQD
ncbi:hypothetical protein ACWGKK_36680 [Streptomyces chartreusis]